MFKKMVAPALGFTVLVVFLLAFFGLVCGIGYLYALISGLPATDLEMLAVLGGEGLLRVFQVCVILVAIGIILALIWFFSREMGKALLECYAKWRLRKTKGGV